jgi:3-dehydroquinate synthetase
VRFVLLHEVGHPMVVDGVTDEEVRDVLSEMGATA